ncbi:MAG: class I SAM-dependent methyltransferase [Sphingomonadales bacterium]|jgi:predicted methyltransferase
MNNSTLDTVLVIFFISVLSTSAMAFDHHGGPSLKTLIEGEHRSYNNITRNEFRHPVETLGFFGIKPDMTVVEISPGGGWYTEILAPFLHKRGKLFASSYDPSVSEGRANSIKTLLDKFQNHPELYSNITLNVFDKGRYDLAPEGSADMVLTFRNLHNWMTGGYDKDALEAIYKTLRPGGIFGLVDHRAKPSKDFDPTLNTGYVPEDYILALAKEVGFEFLGSSDFNNNPKDTKDHPRGVWTLPPTFRLKDVDRAKYDAIGESDRMTLKFRRPE